MKNENGKSGNRAYAWTKPVIAILAVLVVLSAGFLGGRYVYFMLKEPAQSTTSVPDNLIGGVEGDTITQPSATEPGEETQSTEPSQETTQDGRETTEPTQGSAPATPTPTGDSQQGSSVQAPVLSLYQGRPEVNQPFRVSNMLPGDQVTQYFCIKASHEKDITLFFETRVTEQTKALADVLHIKVTHMESGKVLLDDVLSQVDGKAVSEKIAAQQSKESVCYYRIDVSVDTSVGNEYQGAGLAADFVWYVEDEGMLNPPAQTGDTAPVLLWSVLAMASLGLVVVLALSKREEKQNG